MNDYILITHLNDFIFCPYSIYIKNLFGNNISIAFSGVKQIDGKSIHISIDNKKYSSSLQILQSLEVYSNQYKLYGKIDILNLTTKTLIERKKKIVKIYDGYIFQLYAQYYCLIEMGYLIDNLQIYSYDDNKTYVVKLPEDDLSMKAKFFDVIKSMNEFSPETFIQKNILKCQNCIYAPLCTVKEECLDD